VPVLTLLIPLFVLTKLSSKGPFLHWSVRIGKDSKAFKMPKIRTMFIDTPQVATHLLKNPEDMFSPFGSTLRKYSLDELPQIYSILVGDMTFVGPRPALFNQDDLIKMRKDTLIDTLTPGITGWAQVNGRDELSIEEKVGFELDYLHKRSFSFDMYIIWLTIKRVMFKEGISH